MWLADALPDNSDAAAAARLVLARLAECWTECGPGQLAGRPDAQAVECMASIVVCANVLLELLPSVKHGENTPPAAVPLPLSGVSALCSLYAASRQNAMCMCQPGVALRCAAAIFCQLIDVVTLRHGS